MPGTEFEERMREAFDRQRAAFIDETAAEGRRARLGEAAFAQAQERSLGILRDSGAVDVLLEMADQIPYGPTAVVVASHVRDYAPRTASDEPGHDFRYAYACLYWPCQIDRRTSLVRPEGVSIGLFCATYLSTDWRYRHRLLIGQEPCTLQSAEYNLPLIKAGGLVPKSQVEIGRKLGVDEGRFISPLRTQQHPWFPDAYYGRTFLELPRLFPKRSLRQALENAALEQQRALAVLGEIKAASRRYRRLYP